MAYSIYTAYGDGVTNQFTISFGLGYIDKADVKCRVNKEVDGLGQPSYRPLTWITDSLVQVGGTVPANGNLVEFIRTVSKTSLVHDYSDGVEIQEKNLDDSNKQILMAVQEVLDGRFESGLATDLDFANHKAINIAAGTNPNDAVNLTQLEDMTGNAPAYAAAAASSATTATTQAGLATTAKTNAEVAQAAAEAARDAANAAAAGMKWRPEVKVATTGNITLAGTQTIDGIAVIVGNRVLVKDQTTTSQNGVYVVAAGAWSRATDADTWTELVAQVVAIESGTVNQDLIYICTVNAGGTLGSTAVTWAGINIPLQDGSVSPQKISSGYGLVPSGAVFAFAMQTAPSGYLECDGSAISRSAYAALYAAIGTTWGVGDGSSTFNLPDFRAEFLRGWDHGRGVDSGRGFATAQSDAFQGHKHSISTGANSGMTTGVTQGNNGVASPSSGDPVTDGTNGSPRTASETRPRNKAILYCIKT
jgi:microcystin-dependent protein